MFLDGEAGKEFALIKGHKGFVRAAMAHGVPLVPVYGEQVMDKHCFSMPAAERSVLRRSDALREYLPPCRYSSWWNYYESACLSVDRMKMQCVPWPGSLFSSHQ